MVNLTIGTNTDRKTVIVESNKTLKDILSNEEINVTGCALHLNGSLIPGADLDQTLTELGIADGGKAMLIAVMKADSAR